MEAATVRSATCLSKSMKAPPQMNRILVVSICIAPHSHWFSHLFPAS